MLNLSIYLIFNQTSIVDQDHVSWQLVAYVTQSVKLCVFRMVAEYLPLQCLALPFAQQSCEIMFAYVVKWHHKSGCHSCPDHRCHPARSAISCGEKFFSLCQMMIRARISSDTWGAMMLAECRTDLAWSVTIWWQVGNGTYNYKYDFYNFVMQMAMQGTVNDLPPNERIFMHIYDWLLVENVRTTMQLFASLLPSMPQNLWNEILNLKLCKINPVKMSENVETKWTTSWCKTVICLANEYEFMCF